MDDHFWIDAHLKPFVCKALSTTAGSDILEAMTEIKKEADCFWASRRAQGANQQFRTRRKRVIRGNTAIDIIYDRSRSAVIDIRLLGNEHETLALLTNGGTIIQKLPDSILPDLATKRLSDVIDLASFANTGFGFEQDLNYEIKKAIKHFGNRTLLAQNHKRRKITCEEAISIWKRSAPYQNSLADTHWLALAA